MRQRIWLAARAALTPEAPAIHFAGKTWSFAELERMARSAAHALRARGVVPGDLVAALVPNGPDFAALVHAAQLCGAALVPLNLRLTPRELEFQLRDSRPRLLVHGADLAPLAEAATRELPHVARVTLPFCSVPEGELSTHVDLADTAAVVYTSGTTGTPKGAELSHGAFLWSALGSACHLGNAPDDHWLACLPLQHVGGLAILYRSVLTGAAVTLHERFDPVRVAAELDRGEVTLVSLVANMLERVLDARGDRPAPPQLRCVLLGGGPAPSHLLRRARSLGFPIATTYGLTEAASQVATLSLTRAREEGESAGTPLFCTELRIDAPPGEPGEILVRGPTLMKGYLRRPEDTARALREGWLHTGDVGVLDSHGELRVLDRRSDLIVSGGENVYPAEVEAALREHPEVIDAGVAAEPDPAFGARVAAWVVLRPESGTSASDITSFCRERLAGYKIPRSVTFVRALPRTESGKLLRRKLRFERQPSLE